MTGFGNRERLSDLVRRRGILLLDGAVGTELSTRVNRRVDAAQINLDCPEAVISVHSGYLRAGAEIITTNSFNLINQTDETDETIRRSAVASVELARRAISRFEKEFDGRKILIAASLGPALSRTPEISERYEDLIWSLNLAGADLLLLETMTSIEAARTALEAARKVLDDSEIRAPFAISAVVSESGTLPGDGAELIDFINTARSFGPGIIGINCIPEIEGARPYLMQIREKFDGLILFSPNAGMPRNGVYPTDPDRFSEEMAALAAESQVDIVGGCCGITFAHIQSLAAKLSGLRPPIQG